MKNKKNIIVGILIVLTLTLMTCVGCDIQKKETSENNNLSDNNQVNDNNLSDNNDVETKKENCGNNCYKNISQNALDNAKANFKKNHVKIDIFLSDGFKNIPVEFNTAVIAGMGTHTILNILNHPSAPEKLMLASNNDYYLLRKTLNEIGYKIVSEDIILENNHYYVILLCIKAYQKLSKKELLYGISNNETYYNYLLNKRKKILLKVPLLKKIKLIKECYELKSLIEKK